VTASAGYANLTMTVTSYSIVPLGATLQCTIYCQPAAAANASSAASTMSIALPAGVKPNVFAATTEGAGSITVIHHLTAGTDTVATVPLAAVTTGRVLTTSALATLVSGDTYQFVIQFACAA